MPSELYDAIVSAAGEAPLYAVQANACFALDEASSVLKLATNSLNDATAAAAREREAQLGAPKPKQKLLDRHARVRVRVGVLDRRARVRLRVGVRVGKAR